MNIICVYGSENHGKTKTLLELKKLCTEVDPINFKEVNVNGCGDVAGFYKYNNGKKDYYIILSTAGDSSNDQNFAFDFYKKVQGRYQVDSIIVAGRTTGQTWENVWNMAEILNVTPLFYQKSYVYNLCDFNLPDENNLYDNVNKSEAKNILDSIVCSLRLRGVER